MYVCVWLCAVKDKAAVQLELEQLQQAHQELTEQVTQLTGDLEKERSKGHALKTELDKLKVGAKWLINVSDGLYLCKA